MIDDALELSDDEVTPSADNPWLCHDRYVRALFDAEHQGRPIQAPPHVIEYMRRFHSERLKCLRGRSPYHHSRELQRAANRYRYRRGWRGSISKLADVCSAILTALADTIEAGKAGRKISAELRYTLLAFDILVWRAMRAGDNKALQVLVERGSGKTPSPGREEITEVAIELANANGDTLDRGKLKLRIRRHAEKMQPPIVNALAFVLHRTWVKRDIPKSRSSNFRK